MRTSLLAVYALALCVAACSSTNNGTGGMGGGGGNAGTGGVGGDDSTLPGVFRAVLMSDTHVIGPQYECCSESPGVDNETIVKTGDRLREVARQVNAITPRPEMVVVLGDVVHAAHHSQEPAWYQDNRNAFTVARELFDLLEMPVYLAWGNHDYEVNCSGDTYDRALTHQIYRDIFDTEPYYALSHRGWKFLFLNSQLGPTWNPDDDRCDTGTASFGAEQLDWTADELEEGLPTIVFSHHNRLFWLAAENPGSSNADLSTVLRRYDNFEANFAGHLHRWIDSVRSFGPQFANERVLSGTRYDTDNFWLIEFDGATGSFAILDEDKAIQMNSCAKTFTYDGAPMLMPDAPEEGDCVQGL